MAHIETRRSELDDADVLMAPVDVPDDAEDPEWLDRQIAAARAGDALTRQRRLKILRAALLANS